MAMYRVTATALVKHRIDTTFECDEPEDARSEAEGEIEMAVLTGGSDGQINAIEDMEVTRIEEDRR